MERFVIKNSNTNRSSLCQWVWKQFFVTRILERILPLFFVNGMMDVIFGTKSSDDQEDDATYAHQKVACMQFKFQDDDVKQRRERTIRLMEKAFKDIGHKSFHAASRSALVENGLMCQLNTTDLCSQFTSLKHSIPLFFTFKFTSGREHSVMPQTELIEFTETTTSYLSDDGRKSGIFVLVPHGMLINHKFPAFAFIYGLAQIPIRGQKLQHVLSMMLIPLVLINLVCYYSIQWEDILWKDERGYPLEKRVRNDRDEMDLDVEMDSKNSKKEDHEAGACMDIDDGIDSEQALVGLCMSEEFWKPIQDVLDVSINQSSLVHLCPYYKWRRLNDTCARTNSMHGPSSAPSLLLWR